MESTQAHEPRGTRQIEPALARSAFGDSGIGAAVRKDDRGAEGVCRPDQRADVPRIGEAPEREGRRALLPAGEVGPPVDGDHPRRMGSACQIGEELRVDVLIGAQQVDRLGGRRLDRVLALDEEEPQLLAPAPVVQLPDDLQALVVPGDDHSGTVLTNVFL